MYFNGANVICKDQIPYKSRWKGEIARPKLGFTISIIAALKSFYGNYEIEVRQ